MAIKHINYTKRIWIRVSGILFLALFITGMCASTFRTERVKVELVAESSKVTEYQLFFRGPNANFTESQSIRLSNRYVHQPELLQFYIPLEHVGGLRLDLGESGIENIHLYAVRINGQELDLNEVLHNGQLHSIDLRSQVGNGMTIIGHSPDPFIVFPAELSSWHAKRYYDWLPLLSIFFATIIFSWAMLFKYIPHFYVCGGGREAECKDHFSSYFCYFSDGDFALPGDTH